MPPANPCHVVAELERAVSVRIRPFSAVAEAAEPLDADGRNPPCLRRIQRDAGDVQLLDHVALERQLASERVEEVVVAEPEFVDERRRHRPGVAERDLMNPRVQLRAVQLQRRCHLVLLAVAVAAHPGRCRALHQIHPLRVLILVDDAILQREIVVGQPSGSAVGLRVELI